MVHLKVDFFITKFILRPLYITQSLEVILVCGQSKFLQMIKSKLNEYRD